MLSPAGARLLGLHGAWCVPVVCVKQHLLVCLLFMRWAVAFGGMLVSVWHDLQRCMTTGGLWWAAPRVRTHACAVLFYKLLHCIAPLFLAHVHCRSSSSSY